MTLSSKYTQDLSVQIVFFTFSCKWFLCFYFWAVIWSYIVDLFAALHELGSASARTLLKLASSVRALLKPYGDTWIVWRYQFSGRGMSGDDRARHARDLSARFKIQKKQNKYGGTKIIIYKVFFSCMSEIGSKRKLSFGRQLLSNSVCVRKTLFVTQCPKFKAKVSISVAMNPVGNRDRNNLKTTGFHHTDRP